MADKPDDKLNKDAEAAAEVEETEQAEASAGSGDADQAEASDQGDPPEDNDADGDDSGDEEAEEDGDEGHHHADAHHGGHRSGPVPFKAANGPADGMAAFFVHPGEILDAAARARDKRFVHWDVLTPFPIHGMDDAMGLSRSWMPWVTFAAAMMGLTTALTIQTWTMFVDWQIVIGGKPFFPWPSFMPVTFELSVLFAGIITALTMFLACGLPSLKPKIIDWRITRDRFVLWIDAKDPQYDPDKIREFLEGLEPLEIREVRFDA